MSEVRSDQLLSILEVARRLEITHEAAFDRVFVTRDLPVQFRGHDHGVPEDAAEQYRRAHAAS